MEKNVKRYVIVLMAVFLFGMMHISAGASALPNINYEGADLSINNNYKDLDINNSDTNPDFSIGGQYQQAALSYEIEFVGVENDQFSLQYHNYKMFPEVIVYRTNALTLNSSSGEIVEDAVVSWEIDGTVVTTMNDMMFGAACGTVSVTARAELSGTLIAEKSLEVTVEPCRLETAKVEAELVSDEKIVFDGTPQYPAIWVCVNDIFVQEIEGYSVGYLNNIDAGNADISITGNGNYTGTKLLEDVFTIHPAEFTCEVTQSEVYYNGTEHTPQVLVRAGLFNVPNDWVDIVYENNTNAGTARVTVKAKTGIKNIIGEAHDDFEIKAMDIMSTGAPGIPNQAYTGKEIRPEVLQMINCWGNRMEEGIDYELTYQNNINPGQATVFVTGKGNYTGVRSYPFTILPSPVQGGSNTGSTTAPDGTVQGGGTAAPDGTVQGGGITAPDGTVQGGTAAPDGTSQESTSVSVLDINETIKKTSLNGQFKVTGHAEGGISLVQYVKPLKKNKKSIVIPDTFTVEEHTCKVVSIAKNAFKGNKNITGVKIGKNVTSIGTSAFSGCTKLSKVTIGSKVTTIGTNAFYKCTSLKSITIPSKVNKIGKQAFYGCKKLKSITIKTTKLTKKTVSSKAFSGISKNAVIKVPKSKLKTYRSMLRARGVKKSAVIKK